MNHKYSIEGFGYRLRPVTLSDAQFIVNIRLEDLERNKFIHKISSDVSLQETWLREYFDRDGDCYFIVENRFSGNPEGLIAFYDIANGRAEWGRWVLKKGSFAAMESVYLLYRIAFEQADLQELYCRTIADNTPVVSLHESIGEKTRQIHKKIFEIEGTLYDAVEQYSDKEHFYKEIVPKLEKQSFTIAQRNLKRLLKGFAFHHIGVATKNIEKELPFYSLLGYQKESDFFEDSKQGIKGVFLTAEGQPRLELLENLPNSHTLDYFLENGQKMYHLAYYVENIETCVDMLKRNRARIVSSMKESVYFKKRICFLTMPNMAMIELMES